MGSIPTTPAPRSSNPATDLTLAAPDVQHTAGVLQIPIDQRKYLLFVFRVDPAGETLLPPCRVSLPEHVARHDVETSFGLVGRIRGPRPDRAVDGGCVHQRAGPAGHGVDRGGRWPVRDAGSSALTRGAAPVEALKTASDLVDTLLWHSKGCDDSTSGEAKGVHFAEMLFMGPLAAVAILVLRQFHLVVPSPIWLIPVILVVGQLASTATGFWWDESQTQPRLHLRIATQIILVTAVIYATGWGPALAIGLVLVGQESLAITGSSSLRVVLVWTLSCLAIGEGLVGLGWIPSLVPMPEGYGLAILMGIGIAFSYRSLLSALSEKEETASLTESRERRFRALVQSSSDLVFAVDRNSAVTYASPSCTSVLGYQPDQLVGSAGRQSGPPR